MVVHVVGKVRKPGLQRLPAGSRVAHAVEAAGGAVNGADLARVNLARILVDGEQVVVPAPGDPDPPGAPTAGGGGGGTGGSGGGSAAGGSGTGSGGGGLVSINTADLSGLDTLPGVGPVLAQRILDWRTEHGRSTTVDELGEVSGIGEKMMERLRPLARCDPRDLPERCRPTAGRRTGTQPAPRRPEPMTRSVESRPTCGSSARPCSPGPGRRLRSG